jgi:hypothetical protein
MYVAKNYTGRTVILVYKYVNTAQGSNSSKNTNKTGDIMNWGSHGSEYEDGCLLGCSTMQTGMGLPTFQRSVLPPSSGVWWRRQYRPLKRW